MESLDAQLMAFADRAEAAGNTDVAEGIRTNAAYIREAMSGADTYETLADALRVVADNAESAYQVVARLTVPPVA
jgi:hypothetical protein